MSGLDPAKQNVRISKKVLQSITYPEGGLSKTGLQILGLTPPFRRGWKDRVMGTVVQVHFGDWYRERERMRGLKEAHEAKHSRWHPNTPKTMLTASEAKRRRNALDAELPTKPSPPKALSPNQKARHEAWIAECEARRANQISAGPFQPSAVIPRFG